MPVWKLTIDLKAQWDAYNYSGKATFVETRDQVVQKFRDSGWDAPDLMPLLDELKDTEDVVAFRYVFDEIYDLADADRVWIETR